MTRDGCGCAHDCCGTPSPRGYLYHEPKELVELITTAHRLGLRTATHAQGEVPIGLVLDAVEQARASDPRPGLRHRIEHCGFPTDEQVARMARLGVVPVPQPMQVHLYADSLIEEFGEYGGRFYPYGAFERAGVPVVVSSDAPVTMPGPLKAAWAAVTRRTTGGATAGGGQQGVSRSAALRGITETPAALLDRPDIGALRVGARADLVIVDVDPVTAPLDALATAAVTETWVGGERVWSVNGKGILPETHPLSLGAAIRLAEAHRIISGAQALLVVGSVLGDDELWGHTVQASGTVVRIFGTAHQWPSLRPGQFVYPAGYATLGYGIPGGIGAALAAPGTPVVVLAGDGGTMFTIQEFATAVDLGLGLPVVVMNNGGFQEIREGMADRGIQPLAVDVRSPDFPLLGKALGGEGRRADAPAELAAAVTEALEGTVPTLIEVCL